MAIWQDLVDDRDFSGRRASVHRFVARLRGAAPGEEGQVDDGAGPVARSPESGKCRRTRLFLLTQRRHNGLRQVRRPG